MQEELNPRTNEVAVIFDAEEHPTAIFALEYYRQAVEVDAIAQDNSELQEKVAEALVLIDEMIEELKQDPSRRIHVGQELHWAAQALRLVAETYENALHNGTILTSIPVDEIGVFMRHAHMARAMITEAPVEQQSFLIGE
jgi:predicted ATPase